MGGPIFGNLTLWSGVRYYDFSEFCAQIVLVLRTGGYGMGTLLGTNAVIFWKFSTYVAVIISGYPKIVKGSGSGKQKPVEVNCCKSWI